MIDLVDDDENEPVKNGADERKVESNSAAVADNGQRDGESNGNAGASSVRLSF